ncbi:MAG: peptidoglycan-binding protein [Acidimicrobiales bacterium]|jgi:N-acetylmuramoyl-L-alanine amidase
MSRSRTVSPREDLLPLHEGASGKAVVDLQERLERLGLGHGDDGHGAYGPGTSAAVQVFQSQRGLRADGTCDHETWSSLVEAGFRLGDRLLYRRSPMLQGDDVADLQRRLSGLGFDPGGVDGIFGDNTHAAIAEFQHNMGLVTDGICGPVTLSELKRVAPVRGGSDLVTPLREQLRVAATPATLSCKKIAVGEEGGFATGVAAIHRALLLAGAQSLELHDPDPFAQAQAANTAQVDCYIGLRLEPGHESVKTYFYRGFRYESAASRRLAELLLEAAAGRLELPQAGAHGMADVILRRTAMPAVVLELGAPHQVTMKTSGIAKAVQESLERWLTMSGE